MSITRNFNLYLNAGQAVPLVINVNQYDQDEEWVFTLYNSDGTKYTPTTGAIVGIKSDGNLIANAGTVNSAGQVVIAETQQMTAAAGKAVFELQIDNETHGTANFVVLVEEDPSDGGTVSASDISLLRRAISGGMSDDAINALLACFQNVAWANANGQTYYQALSDALLIRDVVSISAVYTQGGTVYATDDLDDLKADLVVTATYDDYSTGTVASSAYTLSGTLTGGTSTITVTYSGQTTTFTVTVTAAEDVTPDLATFVAGSSYNTVVIDSDNQTLRVYNSTSKTYQGCYAPFTMDSGYTYKLSFDAVVTSGVCKAGLADSNNSVSGRSTTTTSESGHIDKVFAYDSTVAKMFFYCTWATATLGDTTYSNIKMIKYAEE